MLTMKHGDNSGYSATTTYFYNDNGLPKFESVVPRQTSFKHRYLYYDSTCRFVVRRVDQANNNTYKTFDPATGLCLTETDINGFVTSHEYDDWGRLTKTIYPDSTSRTITYTNASGGLANTQYYKSIVESGKPETRVYYDLLGRNTHTYTAGQGYMDVVYDELGQVAKQTIVPYNPASLSASLKKWRIFKHDSFGRVTKDSSRYQEMTYSYGVENNGFRYAETVENKMGAVSTKYYDAVGRVVEVSDDGGSITYTYDRVAYDNKNCDRLRITTNGNMTTVLSDSRGNRLKIIDPDAGTVTSTYDLWNNPLSQTDGKGDVVTMTYDNQSRMTSKVYTHGGNTDRFLYGYGTTSPKKGRLTGISRNNSSYQQFIYDSLGRLRSSVKHIDTLTFTHQYTYNNNGQLYTIQYPSGYVVRHSYDSYGRLSQLQNHSNNAILYTIASRNALNQPTLCWYGNNTGVETTCDAWGLPTQIKHGYRMVEWPNFPNSGTELPQDEIMGGNRPPDIGDPLDPILPPTYYVGNQYSIMQYTYNDCGYITRRKDAKYGQQEDYTYDIMGRLTSYTVNDTMSRSFNYASNGNITRNSKLGSYDYVYGSSRPHAVTQVYDEHDMIPSSRCDVTYNSRNRAATISEANRQLELSYGEGLQREKTVFSVGGNMVKTVFNPSQYCEYEKTPSYSRYIDYIYADGKPVALHVHNITANADSMYYIQTDMLGSWERVVNASKGVVQSSHFDPWGNRMTVANWTAHHPDSVFQFRRGFTGHEHYDRFGIINMNARLYDPAIGRFFSPDPQVQNPFSTQGYNRYSYCGNNPVMYTDPDGELFVIDSWLFGFIHGFFSTGKDRWKTAWNTANRLAGNDFKIIGGLFVTDHNKSFWSQTWEVLSRFTWQAPQTLAGFALSQFANASEWMGFTNGGIKSVEYAYGATAVTYNAAGWGAITLGSYINGDNSLEANPYNALFQHEYGHYLQSQEVGLFYLQRYGFPSLYNCGRETNHNYFQTEQDANIRAFVFFRDHIEDYSGWKFSSNPIKGYKKGDYGNMDAFSAGRLNLAWYDILMPGDFGIAGFINWLCLEFL